MASTSPVAALYFIALMTFGNYVLFNLLVAILVEGFQTEVGRHRIHKNTLKTAAMGQQKETYFLWILFPGLNTNVFQFHRKITLDSREKKLVILVRVHIR